MVPSLVLPMMAARSAVPERYLLLGDEVMLFSDQGLLFADGAVKKRGLVLQNCTPRSAGNGDLFKCVFRVEPQFSHQATKAFRKSFDQSVDPELFHNNLIDKAALVVPSGQDLAVVESIRQAAVAEAQLNEAELARLRGKPVLYGSIIQLHNVHSQRYLCVNSRETCVQEPTSMSISLERYLRKECFFRILPKFRIRAEGEPVRIGDSIVLQSMKTETYLNIATPKENEAGGVPRGSYVNLAAGAIASSRDELVAAIASVSRSSDGINVKVPAGGRRDSVDLNEDPLFASGAAVASLGFSATGQLGLDTQVFEASASSQIHGWTVTLFDGLGPPRNSSNAVAGTAFNAGLSSGLGSSAALGGAAAMGANAATHHQRAAAMNVRSLRSGRHIRLYHKEFEGYMIGHGPSERIWTSSRRTRLDRTSRTHDGEDKRQVLLMDYTFDPLNPQDTTSSFTFWQLELEDSYQGGVVEWGANVRLRSAVLNAYLQVEPNLGDPTTEPLMSSRDGTSLVSDNFTLSLTSTPDPEAEDLTLFTFVPVNQETGPVTVGSYVRIQHVATGAWLHAVSPSNADPRFPERSRTNYRNVGEGDATYSQQYDSRPASRASSRSPVRGHTTPDSAAIAGGNEQGESLLHLNLRGLEGVGEDASNRLYLRHFVATADQHLDDYFSISAVEPDLIDKFNFVHSMIPTLAQFLVKPRLTCDNGVSSVHGSSSFLASQEGTPRERASGATASQKSKKTFVVIIRAGMLIDVILTRAFTLVNPFHAKSKIALVYFCTKSYELDPFKRFGTPQILHQTLLRETGVIELLMRMLQVPFDVQIRIEVRRALLGIFQPDDIEEVDHTSTDSREDSIVNGPVEDEKRNNTGSGFESPTPTLNKSVVPNKLKGFVEKVTGMGRRGIGVERRHTWTEGREMSIDDHDNSTASRSGAEGDKGYVQKAEPQDMEGERSDLRGSTGHLSAACIPSRMGSRSSTIGSTFTETSFTFRGDTYLIEKPVPYSAIKNGFEPALTRILRLIYRLLKLFLLGGDHHNQLHLARDIETLSRHLDLNIGAADTTMQLISGNALIVQSINESQIQHFVQLLSLRDDKNPSYVDFLVALCHCDGRAIPKNQCFIAEQLLRPMLVDADGDFGAATLFPTRVTKDGVIQVKPTPSKIWIDLALLFADDKTEAVAMLLEGSADQNGFESGTSAPWDTCSDFDPIVWLNNAAQFFEASLRLYASLCLGHNRKCIRMITGAGARCVNSEDRADTNISGRRVSPDGEGDCDFDEDEDEDADKHASTPCITTLEECMVGLFDEALPRSVNALYADCLRVLFVDCYPIPPLQSDYVFPLHKIETPPTIVSVLQHSDMSGDAIAYEDGSDGDSAQLTPDIAAGRKRDDDTDSITTFNADENEAKPPTAWGGTPTGNGQTGYHQQLQKQQRRRRRQRRRARGLNHTQFAQLSAWILSFLERHKVQHVESRTENQLMMSTVVLVRYLVLYGYYREMKQLFPLLSGLIGVLDGREDARNETHARELQQLSNEQRSKDVWWSRERYEFNEMNKALVDGKIEICRVMEHILNLRADWGVSMFCHKWLEATSSKQTSKTKTVELSSSKSNKPQELAFTDIKHLVEETISQTERFGLSAKLIPITMDLIRYDSDQLRRSAIQLLHRLHLSVEELTGLLQQSMIITDDSHVAVYQWIKAHMHVFIETGMGSTMALGPAPGTLLGGLSKDAAEDVAHVLRNFSMLCVSGCTVVADSSSIEGSVLKPPQSDEELVPDRINQWVFRNLGIHQHVLNNVVRPRVIHAHSASQDGGYRPPSPLLSPHTITGNASSLRGHGTASDEVARAKRVSKLKLSTSIAHLAVFNQPTIPGFAGPTDIALQSSVLLAAFEFLHKFAHRNRNHQMIVFSHLDMLLEATHPTRSGSDRDQSAECVRLLANLLSQSVAFCMTIAERQVRRILELSGGRFEEYLELAKSIIKVEGKVVKRNQNLVMKLLLEYRDLYIPLQELVDCFQSHSEYTEDTNTGSPAHADDSMKPLSLFLDNEPKTEATRTLKITTTVTSPTSEQQEPIWAEPLSVPLIYYVQLLDTMALCCEGQNGIMQSVCLLAITASASILTSSLYRGTELYRDPGIWQLVKDCSSLIGRGLDWLQRKDSKEPTGSEEFLGMKVDEYHYLVQGVLVFIDAFYSSAFHWEDCKGEYSFAIDLSNDITTQLMEMVKYVTGVSPRIRRLKRRLIACLESIVYRAGFTRPSVDVPSKSSSATSLDSVDVPSPHSSEGSKDQGWRAVVSDLRRRTGSSTPMNLSVDVSGVVAESLNIAFQETVVAIMKDPEIKELKDKMFRNLVSLFELDCEKSLAEKDMLHAPTRCIIEHLEKSASRPINRLLDSVQHTPQQHQRSKRARASRREIHTTQSGKRRFVKSNSPYASMSDPLLAKEQQESEEHYDVKTLSILKWLVAEHIEKQSACDRAKKPELWASLESTKQALQVELNRLGCTLMAERVLTSDREGVVGAALELLIVLLDGGNRDVQDTLQNYWLNTREERFFFCLHEHIQSAISYLKETKQLMLYNARKEERESIRKSTVNALAVSGNDSLSNFENSPRISSPSLRAPGSRSASIKQLVKEGELQRQMTELFASDSDGGLLGIGNLEYGRGVPTAGSSTKKVDGTNKSAGKFNGSSTGVAGARSPQKHDRSFRLVRGVMRLIQLICEGHNFTLQEYMKYQPDNIKSFDLVRDVVNYLHAVVPIANEHNIPVIVQVFDTLIDLAQGCIPNQVNIFNSKIIQPVNHILAETYSHCPAHLVAKLKGHAVLCLLSLLEDDSEEETRLIFREMSSTLDLESVLQNLNLVYEQSRAKRKSMLGERFRKNNSSRSSSALKTERENPSAADGQSGHASSPSLAFEQTKDKSEDGDDALENSMEFGYLLCMLIITLKPMMTEEQRTQCQESRSFNWFRERTGRIEILREHSSGEKRLYMVLFPIPEICHYLRADTKQRFLWSRKRDTANNKIEDFVDQSENIIYEIKNQARVAGNKWLKALANYYNMWWLSAYILTLLINVGNLWCMAAPRQHLGDDENDFSTCPFSVDFGRTVLGLLHLVFWSLSTAEFTIIQLPLLVNRRRLQAAAKKKDKMRKDKVRRGTDEDKGNPTESIGSMQVNEITNMDMLIGFFIEQKALYHGVMVLLSCAGLWFPSIYAIHLLDFLFRDEVLQGVIASITLNWNSLSKTALLGVIIVYIYSVLSFVFFRHAFDTGRGLYCDSLFECFITILSYGVRAGGGVGDLLNVPIDENLESYAARIALDLSFFLVVVIFILNVIFGIIFDTFGLLREERRAIHDDLRTSCFICSIHASEFQRSGKGFDHHVKHEHNIWHYLFFIVHLNTKDVTEYTSHESYVADKLAKNDMSFFPVNRALALNRRESEEDQDERLKKIEEKLSMLADQVAQVASNSNPVVLMNNRTGAIDGSGLSAGGNGGGGGKFKVAGLAAQAIQRMQQAVHSASAGRRNHPGSSAVSRMGSPERAGRQVPSFPHHLEPLKD
ncbi:hypothetical protein HK102_001865 [Quaeritorhiza haematococci]|nr:hypothetical protein HK102_001865 [Quaeritorhiza haematococci]